MRQDAKPNIEAVMSDPAWAAQTRMKVFKQENDKPHLQGALDCLWEHF